MKPYPSPGNGDDGPPVLYQGQGVPSTGDVPWTGVLRILVCLVNPAGRIDDLSINITTTNPINELWVDKFGFGAACAGNATQHRFKSIYALGYFYELDASIGKIYLPRSFGVCYPDKI